MERKLATDCEIPNNIQREAVAKAAASDEGDSTSWIPLEETVKNCLYSVRKHEKKKAKQELSEQNTDPNLLDNEEIIVPDVEMQCDRNSVSPSRASTSLVSNSDVVVKKELIEVELEPNIFDDSSSHSSIADGPSEPDGPTASTSYQPQSESSNSNADMISSAQVREHTTTPTLSHDLNAVKIEPDFSDERFEKNDTLPSVVSVQGSGSPSRVMSLHPTVSTVTADSSISNMTNSESFSSSGPSQIGVTSHKPSPSVSQTSSNYSQGKSYNSVPIHPGAMPLPRDRFDAFGEFIASKLRNLDPNSSAYVQMAFTDLLHKAELGMFINTGTGNTTKTDDVQREATSISSEKENIQPKVPPMMENPSPYLNIHSPSLSRSEPTQPRIPHHTIPSFHHAFYNTAPPNPFMIFQPRVPVVNCGPSPIPSITIPESSSRNNRILTGISSYTRPPFPPPNLETSYTNTPIQTRVPHYMRPRDEFDVYEEFVAIKLRNLDPRSRAFVQAAFADLIFEAELGRFLSDGEKSIFANKTNDILRNMPRPSELSLLKNVVSKVFSNEAQPPNSRETASSSSYAGQTL